MVVFGKGGDIDVDYFFIVLWGEVEVGFYNCFFDWLNYVFFLGLNNECMGVRGVYVSDLI